MDDKSAGKIERELGITLGLLLKWRARYQALHKNGHEVSLEPNDLEAARAEIRLKRELSETEEEHEILKKAVNAVIMPGAAVPQGHGSRPTES